MVVRMWCEGRVWWWGSPWLLLFLFWKRELTQVFMHHPRVWADFFSSFLFFNFSFISSSFTPFFLAFHFSPSLSVCLHQVFWGQEHLNCLKLVEEHLQTYLNLQGGESAESSSWGKKPCHSQPPPSPGSPSPRTEHSSDDLRTGQFHYIQDSGECLDSVQRIYCIMRALFTRL